LAEKGFGFIDSATSSKSCIFFFSDVRGGVLLQSGDSVTFEVLKDNRDKNKSRAKNISLAGVPRAIDVNQYLTDLLTSDVKSMILQIVSGLDVWRFCLRKGDGEFSPKLCLLILRILSRDGITDTMLTKPLYNAFTSLVGSDFLLHRAALPGAVRICAPDNAENREIILRTMLFIENFTSILDYNHSDQLPLDELRRVLARPDAHEFADGLAERFAEVVSSIDAQAQVRSNSSKLSSSTMSAQSHLVLSPAYQALDRACVLKNHASLSIFPVAEELLLQKSSFWSFLPVVHSQEPYPTAAEYLWTQTALYRADSYASLRKCIQSYLQGTLDDRDMHVYSRVQLTGVHFRAPGQGLAYCIKFSLDDPKGAKKDDKKKKKVDWAHSSRLTYGNLVAFTQDDFLTVFWGTVAHRDEKSLEKGLLFVEFSSHEDALQFERVSQQSRNMIMAESPTFFLAYRPVLESLRKIKPLHVRKFEPASASRF
jgi:cold shock CspA family protein